MKNRKFSHLFQSYKLLVKILVLLFRQILAFCVLVTLTEATFRYMHSSTTLYLDLYLIVGQNIRLCFLQHIAFTEINANLRFHSVPVLLLINMLKRHIIVVVKLTPWSRDLPENLTGPQPVKTFPAYYGIRKFITAFTGALRLSLSQARTMHSMPRHPPSRSSILTLYSQ
jgi:hypothetical protein